MRSVDLAHIHTSNRYARLAHTIAARVLGARVVHTVHGHSQGRLARICMRISCRLGHAQIAVSDAVAEEIGRRSHILPAFLPPDPEEERIPADLSAWIEARRTQGQHIIAMNAARPMRQNGVDLYGLDLLIAALDDCSIKGLYSAVICIGDVNRDLEYFRELQGRVAEHGLDDHVMFVANGTSFPGVLKRSDVFVRPTTTDGDAISIREALWYGIPVVASDVVGRPQGVTIFRSRDKKNFALAIKSQSLIITETRPDEKLCCLDRILSIYEGALERPCFLGASSQ